MALLPEGDAARSRWWRHRLAEAEATRDVEMLARRLLRAEEERFKPWLLKEAREDLGRAIARLDEARAGLQERELPSGEEGPKNGSRCGPDCWGCATGIGGVHKGRTP